MRQRKQEPIVAAVMVLVFITVCALFFAGVRFTGDVLPPEWSLFPRLVVWFGVVMWGVGLLGSLYLMAYTAVSRWYRHKVVDDRIIRQAKAAGVWDKTPTVLGGRALDLKAWEAYKIERRFGESDKSLRVRCWAADIVAKRRAETPEEQMQGGEGE